MQDLNVEVLHVNTSPMGSDKKKTIVKILLLGDGAVGKTSLRKEYTGEGYSEKYSMTMGAEFSILRTDDSIIQIYDLAGQSNFKSIRTNYYKGSQGAILVFDVTKRASFKSLDAWIQELNIQVDNDIPLIVVGNKIDLRENKGEEVSTEMIKSWINELDRTYKAPILYLETSVITQYQVFEVFKNLIDMISGENLPKDKIKQFGHISKNNTDTIQQNANNREDTDIDGEITKNEKENGNELENNKTQITHKVPEPKTKEDIREDVEDDIENNNQVGEEETIQTNPKVSEFSPDNVEDTISSMLKSSNTNHEEINFSKKILTDRLEKYTKRQKKGWKFKSLKDKKSRKL